MPWFKVAAKASTEPAAIMPVQVGRDPSREWDTGSISIQVLQWCRKYFVVTPSNTSGVPWTTPKTIAVRSNAKRERFLPAGPWTMGSRIAMRWGPDANVASAERDTNG